MKYLCRAIMLCTLTFLLVMAGHNAEAAGKGRNSGAKPPGQPKSIVTVPGAPAQIRINRGGQISVQRISPKFEDAAARPGPRIRRDFADKAGQPVPKILTKPDGTREVLPRSGYAIPTRKMENGKLTEKNGGVAINVGKGVPWTRIHPPKKGRDSIPAYPNGYISNSYRHGKPVHPKTYMPIPRESPLAHRDLGVTSTQGAKR